MALPDNTSRPRCRLSPRGTPSLAVLEKRMALGSRYWESVWSRYIVLTLRMLYCDVAYAVL
eukprot:2410388-Rhodomonas_salina.2